MKNKRERKKKETKRSKERLKMTFAKYVQSDRSLDLPAANASADVLGLYVKRVIPLVEEHADEPGSGLLGARVGKVMNWVKDRCDNGLLRGDDGELSTFIPEEFRTFEGEPPIIKMDSVEAMEKFAKEKASQYGYVAMVNPYSTDVSCPRTLLIDAKDVDIANARSLDELSECTLIADIRVDPTGKFD